MALEKAELVFKAAVEYDKDQINKTELIIAIARSIYETINTPGIFDIKNVDAYEFVMSIGGPIRPKE